VNRSEAIFSSMVDEAYNPAMRYLTATLAVLTTSLWFGGCVTLAVLAVAVFKASGLDRETAGNATSAMFRWFGVGQLLVGAVALIAAFLGYLLRPKAGPGGAAITVLFSLLALASLAAVAFNMHFVPRIEELRKSGQAQSAAFQTLHKQSEHLMTGLTLVLLVAVVLLPGFCRAVLAPRRSETGSPA
jgi:hypothetical protein